MLYDRGVFLYRRNKIQLVLKWHAVLLQLCHWDGVPSSINKRGGVRLCPHAHHHDAYSLDVRVLIWITLPLT